MIMHCLPSLFLVSQSGSPQVGVQLDPMEVLRFVAADFTPMYMMCKRAGFSERSIYDRTRAVFEYFGFPFDADTPL